MTWDVVAFGSDENEFLGPSWSWTAWSPKITYDMDLTISFGKSANSLYDIKLGKHDIIRQSTTWNHTGLDAHIVSVQCIISPVRATASATSYRAAVSHLNRGTLFGTAVLDDGVDMPRLKYLNAIWIHERRVNDTSGGLLIMLLVVPNKKLVGTWKRVGVAKCNKNYENMSGRYDVFDSSGVSKQHITQKIWLS